MYARRSASRRKPAFSATRWEARFSGSARSCTCAAPSSANAQREREPQRASRDAAPARLALDPVPELDVAVHPTPTDRPEQLLHPRIDDRRDALRVAEERTRVLIGVRRGHARPTRDLRTLAGRDKRREVPSSSCRSTTASSSSLTARGGRRACRTAPAARRRPRRPWRGRERLADRDEQIRVAQRRLPHVLQSFLCNGGVPLGPDALRPLDLAPLGLGVEAVSSISSSSSSAKRLTPTTTRSPAPSWRSKAYAASSISCRWKPCSTGRPAPPSSSIRPISSQARSSSSRVSDSTK